uniref:EGF-like domain-containing protein n=1 Tax=Anopheles coluzzii TaxID=1518534 RepID=A0A8W7PUL2_ANOCL
MIDTATGQAHQQALLLLVALVCTLLLPVVQTRQEYYYTYQDPYEDDLSLWINEQQIGRRQRSTCKRPCKHGLCQPNHTCACDSGWYGRLCNQREKKRRNTNGAGGGGDTGGGGGGPARLPKK